MRLRQRQGNDGGQGTKRLFGAAVAAICVCTTLGVTAGTALAAQSTDEIICNGQTLVLRHNNSHSSENGGWASVQVLTGGTGHLTPVAFSATLFDNTINQTVFQADTLKGNGNGNHQQQQQTCRSTITGTLEDFAGPGDQLPPGAQLSDAVTLTLIAVVVRH